MNSSKKTANKLYYNKMTNIPYPLITLSLLILTLFPSALFADLLSEGEAAIAEEKYNKALKLFSSAAKRGKADGEYGMGVLYSEGWGVNKSETKAFDWFHKAASQGFPPAQYSIGNAYFNGTGVEISIPEAEIWWDTAARNGYGQAQFNLGMLLFNSSGSDDAKEQGIAWTRAAAQQGITWADRQLTDIDEPTDYSIISFDSKREPARSEARITTLPPNHFTIHLATTTSLKSAIEMIQFNKLGGRALIYRSTKNEAWFGIVYGIYESMEDAQETITSMKSALKKTGPSIYLIQSIQDEIEAWRLSFLSNR
jgi:tetratricopeptide (TPR) repeat protein